MYRIRRSPLVNLSHIRPGVLVARQTGPCPEATGRCAAHVPPGGRGRRKRGKSAPCVGCRAARSRSGLGSVTPAEHSPAHRRTRGVSSCFPPQGRNAGFEKNHVNRVEYIQRVNPPPPQVHFPRFRLSTIFPPFLTRQCYRRAQTPPHPSWTRPAGAPRPAINPTNLLFTAAVVLDSVAATAAGPTPEPLRRSNSKPAEGAGDHGSRRQRFSPAEKALMELADEVVAALESEQRRSDASAERRRFLVDRLNSGRSPRDNHREGGGIQVLGRPPIGVPPLIWAMEIHLVSCSLR